ncbi:M24 family metallopeptidase [Patescibacteria group bacterium]
MKAGINGKKADHLSRKIIEDAGYGEFYGHSGGHGVGLEIHEIPSLAENYTENLKQNSVVTVEPGIYLPGKFGVRLEDMALVQKNDVKNLTNMSKKITIL